VTAPASPVERLREALVTPHPGSHGTVLTAEAGLLLDALSAAAAQQRLAEQFAAAVAEARLEALRELAYGAGHEINNPLANIAARAQALLPDEQDAERKRRLSTIVGQAFRARDMIGGLMLFARPPKPQPAETDLGGLVASVIDSVQQAAAGRGVRLHYSPSPTPLSAHVDRGQIEEAVRVIAINAIEAVDDGGRVTLSVGMVAGSSAPASGWCEIVVADDGKGMDAASLQRAFDPFYSGREAGRGAGLGLSKAWRFAEASGGRVVVESRPGEGTRVAVVLPTQSLSVAR
jgi:signal transduction histidine kinase